MEFGIIPREKWGARYQDGFGSRSLPIPEKFLHHSVTIAPDLIFLDIDGDGVDEDEERAMRTLEDIGQDRFQGGISYTFCVMPSGRIYEGHSIGRVGAHTYAHNTIAAGICLVGNHQQTDPTEMQRMAIAWLLQHGVEQGWWFNNQLTGGHRDVYSTGCPGDEAYNDIPYINHLAATGGFNQELDDMYSEKDRARDNHAAYRLHALVNVLGETVDDPNAPQPPERIQASRDINATKWRVYSLLHLLDEGAHDTIEGEPLPFVEKFNKLIDDVEAIKAKLELE